MRCPLCGNSQSEVWSVDKMRTYYQCESCTLIYVSRSQLISSELERAHYDTHENFESDLRYRDYLTNIARGVLPWLRQGDRGLDFGCGSSTLLSTIFKENGFEVDSFDLYYHPIEKIWQKKYEFIVLSEVIEHIADLSETMERVARLLTSNGRLFIKTKYAPSEAQAFSSWHYKNDPTHIRFFNERSMKELAEMLGMVGPVELTGDLRLLRRQD